MNFSESDFLAELRAAGIGPAKTINFITDGKIHRYRVEGDKSGSMNGWYVLYIDGVVPVGVAGSWKTDESITWFAKSQNTLSPSEQAALRQRTQEAKAARDAELLEVRKAARKKAEYLYSKAKYATNAHVYLINKQVKSYGLKQLKNMLLVPVRSADGQVISMQFILPDGSKRFLTGGEVLGGYFAIGKPNGTLCICEGYATGASIYEATGYAVAVAFNAGNLLAVACALRQKFPELTLIVCADNDVTTDGNPGLSKAEGAAGQISGMLACAKFQDSASIDGKVPTDFNDMHRLYGLPVVKAAVESAILVDRSLVPGNRVGVTLDRAAIDQMIEETDDFDKLTGDLVKLVVTSALSKPAKEFLLARIAKKAGVPKSSLLDGQSEPSKQNEHDYGALVDELNHDHAVISVGGRVLIMNREFDTVMERPLITFSSKSDFELKYCNRKVWTHGEEKGLGSYWIDHPKRQEYKTVVFSPGRDIPWYFNLWQGWGVEPVKGCCDAFLDFIADTVCGGDTDLFNYVIRWCAHLVQKPAELPETALVLRGREGIGKNTFVEALGKLVGDAHFIQLTSFNQVVGRFSGHLADKLLVFCNESIWGGDKSAQGVLKSMISDGTQSVEYKGKDIITVKSFRRTIFATNEHWAVPRGIDDRRYVIIDMTDRYKGDFDYFSVIKRELANGGYGAFMHFLYQIDLSKWNARDIPKSVTERGWDLKIQSGGSILQWWFDMLQRGWLQKEDSSYADDNKYAWPTQLSIEAMRALYLHWCSEQKVNHPEHSSVLGKMLIDFGLKRYRPRKDNPTRKEFYHLVDLDQSRLEFSRRLSIPPGYWDTSD